MISNSGFRLPSISGARPWNGLPSASEKSPAEFSFALISDRTGLPKPGVFERAVEAVNQLRPEFAIHLGDCIEGYTQNRETLATEWAEFDQIIDGLEVPFFRLPGNHDISNAAMREIWRQRYGTTHYSFRYRDVLFLMLDTQDPPQRMADFGGLGDVVAARAEDPDLDMDALRRTFDNDRRSFAERVERSMDGEGTQPVHISDEQTAWAVRTLRENADARWTFLMMHIPAWQGEPHPALRAIRDELGPRPYTAFAGHLHNYQRRVIKGRDHIRLGPSGGAWTTTQKEGSFDHVTWISMTSNGPRVVNLVLDGIIGVDGGCYQASPMFPES